MINNHAKEAKKLNKLHKDWNARTGLQMRYNAYNPCYETILFSTTEQTSWQSIG